MKVSRATYWAAGVLVLFCVGAGGFLLYKKQEEEKAHAAQQALIKAQAVQLEALRQAQILAESSRPMVDKSMRDAVPKAYPRSTSEWRATEKTIYQKLVSSGQFDVLVVPFQVQEYALSVPIRSLMTAEFVQVVSKAQIVPDPYLVARALGDGDRRLDPQEVYALADKIGVKKIIWGYVGHNRKNEMALSIQSQARDAKGILNEQTASSTKNFEHIVFTDENPPIEVYQQMLPEVLVAAGFDGSALTSPKLVSHIDSAGFLPNPMEMFSGKGEPARDALYFQLLAYLTPHSAERTQARFAEKSMLAILNMSPNSPDYRILKARALMLLGLRPAALQVLGEPKTSEEKELLAALNGNQPDVALYGSQIKPSIRRFLAKFDENFLAIAYGGVDRKKAATKVASLKLPGKKWQFLAARAFSDLDNWAQFDNIYLKQLLDLEFPIKDYTAEGMIRGAVSLGDTAKLQTLADLSVINHVRKVLEIETEKWCCQSALEHPSALDYLSLMEAIGNDDLIRRADFFTQTQGAPERAIEFLNQIENVYKGHPQFLLARAQAQIEKAKSAEGAEKEGLLKSAYMSLFDVMYWEQGQSFSSATAFNLAGGMGRQEYVIHDNYYAADYPFRSYYPNWEQGGATEFDVLNAEAALRNSTSDLVALTYLDWYYKKLSKQEDKHDALFKSIEGRFAGSPAVYQLRANNSLKKGDVQAAADFFEKCIKLQPSVWKGYMDLGTLLIEQGQLGKASRLFLAYPGFKKGADQNPVGISNSAYTAGSKFYWMGEFSLATPLYKIASRQETGSSADITSRLRLKLLDGDYRGALLGSLDRANRYNDTYAYRDYLGLLHAMGASKEAWDAFNVLVNQVDDSHIWETALVGHRKEGKSEAEITAWVKQVIVTNKDKNSDRASKYFLRAGVTDRIPSKEIVGVLADFARPVWKVAHAGGYVVQPSTDGSVQNILGPQSAENSVLPVGVFESAQKSRVKSSLVYFAEGYRAIRTGDFVSAKLSFQEASTLYDLSHNEQGYLLPYYAFAAAKAGDAAAVEKYIATFRSDQKGFDYFLAQAVVTGIGGKTEEAVQFLKSALYRRPFTEERPLQTEYEYAEICEWLYESTGNSKYKELALDWARKNQKFQPWFAWAYAMEAIFSNNGIERQRAIAMASYLDSQSEMLGRVPKKEREEAVRKFKEKNPFLNRLDAVVQTAT